MWLNVVESTRIFTYLSACLGNTKESKRQSQETKGGEEDVCSPSDRVKHVRGDEADDASASVLESGAREFVEMVLTSCTSR